MAVPGVDERHPVATRFRTIHIEPDTELDRALRESDPANVVIESRGTRYRLLPDTSESDIWHDYDPAASLAGTVNTAGHWRDIDAEAFKEEIRKRRRTSTRPDVEL